VRRLKIGQWTSVPKYSKSKQEIIIVYYAIGSTQMLAIHNNATIKNSLTVD